MDIFNEEQSEKFEAIWIDENITNRLSSRRKAKTLDDDEYIAYHIWKDANIEKMYAKHSPNTRLVHGENPNIIFHGGCLGCLSQRKHGIERCKGCEYFKFGTNSENLFIEGEESAKMTGDDFKRLFGIED